MTDSEMREIIKNYNSFDKETLDDLNSRINNWEYTTPNGWDDRTSRMMGIIDYLGID